MTTKKPVLLVEGELCALTAAQEAGDLITAVATGAKDAGQAGRWIARLAAAPLVLLAFDAEPGKGDAAAARWGELLPHNSRRWRPLLKDVNDMHRAGLSVRDWVRTALALPKPYRAMTWPPSIPAAALPPFITLADGRRRVEYRTESELNDHLWALGMWKAAEELAVQASCKICTTFCPGGQAPC